MYEGEANQISLSEMRPCLESAQTRETAKVWTLQKSLLGNSRPKKSRAGQRLGRLLILEHIRDRFLVLCDCGTVKILRSCHVNKTRSCGCLLREGANARTHGQKGVGKVTKTYNTWSHMKARCQNPNNGKYSYYGGRGITVCQQWQSFENFLADMGDKPEGYSLERKDVNGNYCPENCRWATKEEQANNRRSNRILTFEGKSQTLAQWAREVGISAGRIADRISEGWTIEKALTTPKKAST